MGQQLAARVTAGRIELALPRRAGVSRKKTPNESVEHQVVELLLARKVLVERHGWRTNLSSELSDGQGAEAAAIHKGHRCLDDGVLRDRRAALVHAGRIVRKARQRRFRTDRGMRTAEGTSLGALGQLWYSVFVQAREDPMQDADVRSATILVVDDNETNRALAKSTLEDEGYRAILAKGGVEAIAAFETERPDCILLDIRMPDLDGFAVCERIRALPGGPETPILFLTALRDVDTFDHAVRSGGNDYLTKPIRPSDLVVRIQSALKVQRLTAELREHFERLKHQRDEMQRLQLQKERLMAFIVHDLKNPVNSMDLHAQALQRDRGLSSSAQDSVTHIRAGARQLGRMILDLLDVSKADEGRLTPKRSDVDLRRVVSDVAFDLGIDAQERGVTLSISLETDRVHADHDLLRRTLANLVENAIRYAPPATSVSITSARGGEGTELRVADAGHGIPLEMREKIFSPFVQVEFGERVAAHTGRGLGLAFCKLVVEAHDGRIWIEDGAPGTVFCVMIPQPTS
jgi:two-component system, sensor histidine kinase and response regulator